MKWPPIVVLSDRVPTRLVVRLLWMVMFWAVGVGCVLVVSVILRGVLRR